jgi:hypothetical protein
LLSIVLAAPCTIIAYFKILTDYTNEMCCGFIMIRIILKLSFFFDDLREIKYILYLSAFIYGLFIGNILDKSQILKSQAILGSMIFVFGTNMFITILYLIEGF